MKITRKENFRVVIYPKSLGDYGGIKLPDSHFRNNEQIQKDYETRCKEIAEQAKRHVDNIHSVDVEYDTVTKCSHCNLNWEVSEDDFDSDFPKGTPVCCNKAIEEHKKQNKIC
jgi:hypothetical protein